MNKRWGGLFRLVAAGGFLALAVLAVVLALPLGGMLRGHPLIQGIAWCILLVSAAVAVHALTVRAWIRMIFAVGAVCVTVGFGMTGAAALEDDLLLTESYSPYVHHRILRERTVNGERVVLDSFRKETYPNGMPRQYTTVLQFPDGRHEVSVNRPYRRGGYTYYQMSCDSGVDPDGYPYVRTLLTVRRDPGVPVVFAGFGLLLAATAALAVREVCRR